MISAVVSASAGSLALPPEIGQFHNSIDIDFPGIKASYEFVDSCHRAAGSQHIVVDHDNVIGRDRIAVYLDGVFAILLIIGCRYDFAGSLPGLRAGTNPAPSSKARIEPQMNPLDSIPTTFSHSLVAIYLRKIPSEDMYGLRIL